MFKRAARIGLAKQAKEIVCRTRRDIVSHNRGRQFATKTLPASSSSSISVVVSSIRRNENKDPLAKESDVTALNRVLNKQPSRSMSMALNVARSEKPEIGQLQNGLSSVELWLDEMRKAANGNGLTHKALLVDAAGTLFQPAQSVAEVYLDIGRKYGICLSEDEILWRYRIAYQKPWFHSRLRFAEDAKPFWRFIVSEATGCSDEMYFEEVYNYYATKEAWKLTDKNAGPVFHALRKAGVKIGVVSNFDTRLRTLLKDLACDHWFDAFAVSAEVEAEKPNPVIFWKACELLEVDPSQVVHVGDDRRNDIWGARDAGCDAWLWNADVFSFSEVACRIGVRV